MNGLWAALFTVAACGAWMQLARRCDPHYRRRLRLPPAPFLLLGAEVFAAASCLVGFAVTAALAAM